MKRIYKTPQEFCAYERWNQRLNKMSDYNKRNKNKSCVVKIIIATVFVIIFAGSYQNTLFLSLNIQFFNIPFNVDNCCLIKGLRVICGCPETEFYS